MNMERFLLLIAIGILIVLAVNQFGGARADSLEGQQAPDFTLPALRQEEPWQLSRLRGQVVVLSFWASWCGPCREELPGLDELSNDFGDRAVTVLAVNYGEAPETARGFLEAEGYTFPVALDEAMTVSSAYGVPPIPRLLVIDPNGTVVHDRLGYPGGQAAQKRADKELRQMVEQLLPTGEAP